MTAKPDEVKLDELKRLLQRLDKTMQASPPVPKNIQGFAPLIPVGQELALAPQPGAALAHSKGAIRDQGSSSTTVRTVVLAAGVSATVSLAVFTLVFGGITTPQRQITPKPDNDSRPMAGMTSGEAQARPAQAVQPKQTGGEERKAPVPPSPELQPAVESTPHVEARADMAVPLAKPANPEPSKDVGSVPTQAPPKETAALERGKSVPASNGMGGGALGALDASQLLRRGLTMLDSGNVGAAQLLLERAADLGSGDAAFALATTYDGAPGSPRSGAAVRPNVDLALRWYERAQELGVADARKRLSELKKGSLPGG